VGVSMWASNTGTATDSSINITCMGNY
jgi:hypothetical protein